jgi:Pectate lyase superfamily protein
MDRRGFLKTIGCAAIGSGALMLGAPKLANSRHLASGEFVPKATNRVNVQDYGAVGDGVHDDTAGIRNAIMATPKNRGGGVFFPQPEKHYRITDSIVITDRPSLCFYGEFKPGQNDDPYFGHHGTAILCEFSNKTAFVFDFNGLMHSGPQFQQLGFIASNNSVSFIEVRDQDNWIIRDCVFRGGKIALNIKMNEDNAWNLVDNCSFLDQSVCGILDEGLGTEVRGGKFLVLSSATGIILTPQSAHGRITNVMFDRGVGIECHGGVHHISDCKFEKCNPGIIIDGDKNLVHLSGRGNRIFGGTYSNTGSVGVGIVIKKGGRNTRIFGPHFAGVATTIQDAGQDTQVIGGVDW